ncbi:S8 family serine peptidase [Acanthopleuribacter pedis]|uniref:S8 family serine peptidase n=1 Tax=Acanthopleuribacter pedis TaxID=442870 RepID=A0A8J7QHB5_9BACT|nr:S8 family serine peptidase [Acanthopleuribacter pedis]MBO1322425.1 S8 family serine peptidase [Acanthopleuribacter pedis]
MMKFSFGWMLVLCLSFSFDVDARSPKIDPAVYDAFADEIAAFRNKRPSPKEAGLRVIIHLDPMGRLLAKDVGREEDGSLDLLAEDVFEAQSSLIDDLQQQGVPARRTKNGETAFAVELMLTYQYAFAATVSDIALLEEVADHDAVTRVVVDNLNHAHTAEGRALTGATRASAQGFNGAGIGVAVIDSHFDLLHPEMGGSTTLPNRVFAGGTNFDRIGASIHSQFDEDCVHGTAVASIVRRYARGVDLYGVVVLPNAWDSVVAEAINWCVTNRNGLNGGDPIRIINMSLGGGKFEGACNFGVMHSAAGTALSRGIIVIASSGNSGWSDSMGAPACSSNVISVGSSWDATDAAYTPFMPAFCSDSERRVDERACYSNTSPVLDVYAPAESVVCASCGGGTAAFGGTSSASPATAGMIAQLLSAKPNLIGAQTLVRNLLRETGRPVLGDSSGRRIDIGDAVASCAPRPTGMTAWWPLGDLVPGIPTVSDLAGTNNIGTKINGLPGTTGRVGWGDTFNGLNQYIRVSHHGDLNLGTGDFTISAWIRTSRENQVIVTKRNSSDSRGYLLMFYNGRLLLQMADHVRGPANFQAPVIPELLDDTWRFVAVTVDRDATHGGRMYVDDELVFTFNPTSRRGSLDTGDHFYIGRQDGLGAYYQGVMDELTLYKRALSAQEVAAEFYAGYLGKCR